MIIKHKRMVKFQLIRDGQVVKTTVVNKTVGFNENNGNWTIPVFLFEGRHTVEILHEGQTFTVSVTHHKDRQEQSEPEFTPEELAELRDDFEAWKKWKEAPIRELRDVEQVLREAFPGSPLLGDTLARAVVDELLERRKRTAEQSEGWMKEP